MTKARLVKQCRAAARLAALIAAAAKKPLLKSATIQVFWFSKTVRTQDADNLLGRLKSTFDGIADAGIVANDRGITHLPPVQTKDATNPRVELVITEHTGGNA